jgi:hypothetical protein
VAFGRRGIGRTAAVSFPLGGAFSEKARNWEQFGDFVQTLTRWIMGDEVPPGLGVRHRLVGSQWTLDLFYENDPWEGRFATSPPRVVMQSGYRDGKRGELVWERLAPGHYSVSTSLEESVPVRAALQTGGSAIPIGPVVAGADSEWQFDEERIAELRETSRASGGGELLDLTKAWREPPDPGEEPIRTPLLLAVLILFLFEAFVTRTGWRLPRFEASRLLAKRLRSSRPEVARTPIPPSASPDPDPSPSLPVPPPVPGHDSRKSRFKRAKRGL